MEPLTAIIKIDSVLYLFPPKDKIHAYPKKTINDLLIKDGLTIDDRLLVEIILKLIDDGYLRTEKGSYYGNGQHFKDVDLYFLTFEGEVFKEKGGYTEQKRINDLRDKYLETAEVIRSRNEAIVAYGTLFGGFVALALLIWEMRHLLLRIWCKI